MTKQICFATVSIILAGSFLATGAGAQTVVTGQGEMRASAPPSCLPEDYVDAEKAADLDAATQCSGEATRLNDYSVSCHVMAHGYAAWATVSASYTCVNP